jgi:CRISPR-associated protein Csm2
MNSNEDMRDQLSKMTGRPIPNTEKNSQRAQKTGDKIVFFKDKEREIIYSSLLDDRAKDWANNFFDPMNKYEKLSATQLRRFHNDVKELEARINAKVDAFGDKGFDSMLPLVKMIKSKVAYAHRSGSTEKKIPKEFQIYMDTMINSINDYKDFKAFSLCFEAVVGYFFGKGGR